MSEIDPLEKQTSSKLRPLAEAQLRNQLKPPRKHTINKQICRSVEGDKNQSAKQEASIIRRSMRPSITNLVELKIQPWRVRVEVPFEMRVRNNEILLGPSRTENSDKPALVSETICHLCMQHAYCLELELDLVGSEVCVERSCNIGAFQILSRVLIRSHVTPR